MARFNTITVRLWAFEEMRYVKRDTSVLHTDDAGCAAPSGRRCDPERCNVCATTRSGMDDKARCDYSEGN